MISREDKIELNRLITHELLRKLIDEIKKNGCEKHEDIDKLAKAMNSINISSSEELYAMLQSMKICETDYADEAKGEEEEGEITECDEKSHRESTFFNFNDMFRFSEATTTNEKSSTFSNPLHSTKQK